VQADTPTEAALDALRRVTPSPEALDPPIRGELFGQARFEQHGRSLAAVHEVQGPGRRPHGPSFFPRLHDNIEVLRRVRTLLDERARQGLSLGPNGAWLTDNAALVDEQLHAVNSAVSRSFFRQLPRLRDEPLAGLPRIYGVAWAYVAHADSELDLPMLEAYLAAYQLERTLTLAEWWALPTTLRVVLVDNLRRLAERVTALQAARDSAHQWIDAPEAERTLPALERLHEALDRRGVAEAFSLQLEQRQDDLPFDVCRELSHWLARRLPQVDEAEARQQSQAAEDLQSTRNAITALRQIDRVDWRGLMARTHPVLQLLAECPVFVAESDDTQDRSLRAVQALARASGLPETDVAEALATLTRQGIDAQDPRAAPEHWWGGDGEAVLRHTLGLGKRRWPRRATAALRRPATVLYLSAVLLASLGGVGWMLHRHADPSLAPWLLLGMALLMLAPASEAVVAVLNRLISEALSPVLLPRLALPRGLQDEHRCLLVIPSMLTSEAGIQALAAQLEQHHLANAEAQLQLGLLTDWADADAQSDAADETLLNAACRAVDALNLRHPVDAASPPRFVLLHRPRRWSETQQRYIGWERKRGKLEQLMLALAPAAPAGAAPLPTAASDAGVALDLAAPPLAGFVDLGRLSRVRSGVRYLLTLDSDTDMPPGRLRALVAVAAHPLNQPRVDVARRRVLGGYGILQPRVVTPLSTARHRTGFHRLFAGQTGVDPYSAASSEVYQDLFGEGTYTGKGLIDVPAARAVLARRLPDEQVLSHDLLEGSLLRCAGVSDVTLVEDAPLHADVAASRLHRWTRGDWQLLPFLWRGGREGVRLINRWKMLDNLRRSLVAPCSAALILWALASGALPLAWTLVVVAMAYGAGPLLGAVAGLAPSRDDIALAPFLRAGAADLWRALLAPLWHLALLLDQALMYGDAIVRALYRHLVSRRQLLQWTTAAAAQSQARVDLPGLCWQHRRTVGVALGLAVLGLWALGRGLLPPSAVLGLPLLAIWAATPLWVWWASRPRPRPRRERLPPPARDYVYDLARDTWRFFARHVGPTDHHLPPDNVQLVPDQMVAHRTSPTNIGLYLLASACARQLGFIGRAELADRLAATLDTVQALPRWHGHLYNWYDTQSLAVLPPAYVSTVDSGNCSAHLLTVAQACEEAAHNAAPALAAVALARSAQRLRALLPVLAASPTLRVLAGLAHAHTAWPTTREDALALRQQVRAARSELDGLNLTRANGDDGGPMWLLHDHVATLESALQDTLEDPAALALRLQAVAARARQLALEPDYGLLYDRRRRLLHIGLRADSGELDANHYDLLASEARLTSLVAIAKGDVPVGHWSALGRPFFARGAEVGLKSWSGSMFEYLMPSLVLDEPPGSVLARATRVAVQEQQAEALPHATPWGISESAIAAQDHTLAFQYGPQGAPRLALRRTPTDERVLAPYATALAVLVAPQAALDNLHALQGMGARRTLGFIEALDFSPRRQIAGSSVMPVHTFMAHHQAMSLVALTDVLSDAEHDPLDPLARVPAEAAALEIGGGAPRRWAMSDPHLRAVRALLHERPPREVPRLGEPAAPAVVPPAQRAHLVLDVQPLSEAVPTTQLLGNGSYAVWLRSHGGGLSRWQGTDLTRWRDDALRDDSGSFLYVERDGEAERHSLTAHPAPDPRARYSARLQPDRACFDTRWPDLHTRTTVWVSPEDDVELRQVELSHRGEQPLWLTLSLASEVTLSAPGADEAHPAFANLFVRAHWDADDQALYLRRQPRLAEESPMLSCVFLADSDAEVAEVSVCTDRARWQGRHAGTAGARGPADAVALDDSAPSTDPSGAAEGQAIDLPGRAQDTGLDPVAVIRVRLYLAAGARARLTFGASAGRSIDELVVRVDKYRHASHLQRSSSMSYTMAGVHLRDTALDANDWRALLRLQTLLSLSVTRDLPTLQPNKHWHIERRLLWRHGLSGERPVLWVSIADEAGLPLVQLLKKLLSRWTAAGLGVDLVVANGEPASYLMPVQRQLQLLRERHLAQQDKRWPEAQRSTMHVFGEADFSAHERQTLLALARVRLWADGRSLAQQVDRLVEELQRDAAPQRPGLLRLPVPMRPVTRLDAAPPTGRFDPDDGRFSFRLDAARQPSRPWINVLANEGFGCHVSEVGAGMTWAGNSRMHQITPWSNDPLADPAGDWLLLHDVDRGQVWPLARALGDGPQGNEVTHGIGFSRIRQQLGGIDVTLTWCVDAELSLKQVQVELQVPRGLPRRLRLVSLVEWVMGASRQDRLSVQTRADRLPTGPQGAGLPTAPTALVLQATQLDPGGGFGGATGWVAWRTAASVDDWTCDRRECFDSAGRLVLPTSFGRRSGLGQDACAALACSLELAAGQRAELALLLGHADSPAAARQQAVRALDVLPADRLHRQRRQAAARHDAVQVKSPDPLFDALVNHWLPYQTLVCRLFARAGFYQAGGALGFRDQLQDAMSLVQHDPERLAEQLRRHAARQFPPGDVQHWWHEPGGAGVRTHFSDDLLWLPLGLSLYVERTGDPGLLDERVPFLVGQAVPEGREDIYETPRTSDETASLYEHGARAIDHSLRVGVHELPLMGTGDWNDGMNRVGHLGRGESVWLAWMLCDVVDRYVPLAQARGDQARVQAWSKARAGWVQALESAGWDGQWYRRAFFDDGSPLGTAADAECRIDLIAQAWAVLSGAGDPARARQAMASAQSALFDEEASLMRLLTPPLRQHRPSAGYIQAYPGGVRENGGQYNHAAVWALMAFARLGQSGLAWRVFQAVSPAHRWQDKAQGARYALEPFVLAGDVYTAPPYVGRGGWSWYTGSAGWLLRAALESMCGVTVADGELHLAPCLPAHWPEVQLSLRHGGRKHRIVLCQGDEAFRAALHREPTAKVRHCGEAIDLDAAIADAVIVVDVSARGGAAVASGEGSARQHQLEQRALTLLRSADE
jgi:cyclic beta-1,2-glucan synthetase